MESKLVQNAIRMDFFYGFLGRSPKLGSWSRGGSNSAFYLGSRLFLGQPLCESVGKSFWVATSRPGEFLRSDSTQKKNEQGERNRKNHETNKCLPNRLADLFWVSLICSECWRTVMEMACRAWCEHEDDDELPDDDGSPAWFCFFPLLFCESTPTNLFPPGN